MKKTSKGALLILGAYCDYLGPGPLPRVPGSGGFRVPGSGFRVPGPGPPHRPQDRNIKKPQPPLSLTRAILKVEFSILEPTTK